jgi:hypothetical protein
MVERTGERDAQYEPQTGETLAGLLYDDEIETDSYEEEEEVGQEADDD